MLKASQNSIPGVPLGLLVLIQVVTNRPILYVLKFHLDCFLYWNFHWFIRCTSDPRNKHFLGEPLQGGNQSGYKPRLILL